MKSRRAFLEEVSFATLIAGFPAPAQAALTRYAEKPPEPLFPMALQPGMTVALVAPASPALDPDTNDIAVEVVASLGFKPKLSAHARAKTNYLAGSDADRAADLNAAFADPSVDAVWCLRGGYGSPRILPFLDYETIRKNPKPFIGYSDITAPLNSINRLTGLVTFHGPLAEGTQTDYTLAAFKKVLYEASPAGRIAGPPPFEPGETKVDRENRLYRMAPGKAKGRLVGGNISVFSTLIGTPFEPELKGRILFLEEVGEDPYRIDRWLTQFVLTGKLAGLSGIALGKLHDCRPGDYKPSFAGYGSSTWQEVCADRLGGLGIPVLGGLGFGHVSNKATLPLGVMAELDVAEGSLTLLEAAVR
jgi:muramoyltetrapeptide carboxypeptidase